jgi:hypothetical protein
MSLARREKYLPEPRGLDQEQAAHYFGVSVPTFTEDYEPHLTVHWVGRKKTKKLFDKHEIDALWDRRSRLGTSSTDDDAALKASYDRMAQREREGEERRINRKRAA